jgi:non-specific serine/threonine protein kinase/serine/threonine-protein kinase
MTALSAQQKHRVDVLLDELLLLPEEQWTTELRSCSGEDAAVAAEVDSLLRAARASGSFLNTPAHLPADLPASGDTIGIELDGWRVTRLIGRGGMGEVYAAVRARGDFDQRVAIKLLRPESAQIERFQSERQILATLEHAGIARLYDGGVAQDGRPFMVMEYVEGRSIVDHCTLAQSSFDARLALFLQVCDAVAYAHRNLVVHRDLKPSNILVTGDGRVKLLDFGIAKLLDSHRSQLTQAAIPMTPVCAAPEQLTGGPITTATDVYALGLLLFEMLTGAHPWMGSDTPVMQAMRAVLQRPAPVASRTAEANPSAPIPAKLIRGDFDAIIAKALRVEPAYRYATVESLKLDIERAQRGEAVEAREGARLYALGRTLRRYRWAAAAVSAIFISLGCGLGVAAWQAHKAAIDRDTARRDAAREEAVRYNLTQLFRTAIADQGAKGATAKTMIDASAQRILKEYQGEPQLAGQIVLTLADLYGALEDVTGAESLLEGFVAEAKPEADPAALADARQKLANIELLRGHPDRAQTLLNQADTFWSRSSQPYVEERLEGLVVRARLQRALGDLAESVATTRKAIAQRIALSGHDHRETAILYNSLAISLAASNRLDEALAAYRETSAIYTALGLGDGLDAQIVIANTGTMELRNGHLREAQVLLQGAIDRERLLAGDSAAVAAAMGYYGKVLLITNRTAPAVEELHAAYDLAVRYAGAGSPVASQNRLFLGEAQLAAGDAGAARLTLTGAHDAAVAQYGAAHLLSLRTELAMLQVDISQGDYQDSALRLTSVIGRLKGLGVQGEPVRAQALETLGTAYLGDHRYSDAAAVLQEAVEIRLKSPADIWEIALAQERLGEALAGMGQSAAINMLKNAARDLESQLGARHPETIRAKSALARMQGERGKTPNASPSAS